MSARELEILAMVANGEANREIANELVIAGETVKSHIASIMVKLGARNRTHAVALAYAEGLIALGVKPIEYENAPVSPH